MTDSMITPSSPLEVTSGGRFGARVRRWVRDERAWLTAALVMNLLLGWSGDEASSVAWLNPLVFAGALVARHRFVRERRWRPAPWAGAVVMIVLGWAAGMVIEATIATGGDGFGGMHPDTVPSFVLAQGYYLPAAVLTWAAVHRYGLDARRAFFFAGAMAWWETLTVGLVGLISPFFVIAPLLIAYYFSTYALCGMAGLLVVDETVIASPRPRAISDRRLLGYGALAGAFSWGFFMAWAGLTSNLFGFSL